MVDEVAIAMDRLFADYEQRGYERGKAEGRAEVLREVATRSSPWVADRDEMGESCFFCGAWHLLNSISRHNKGCLWPQAQAVTRSPEEK